MFLKSLVYPFLVFVLSSFSAQSEDVYEDVYFEQLYKNGEVIACSDEVSFEQLLLGEHIEFLTEFCHPRLIVSQPQFDGWYFLDPPVWVDGTTEFVPVRKYRMVGEDGTVHRFIFPLPLELADYTLFEKDEPSQATAIPWNTLRVFYKANAQTEYLKLRD